MDIRTATPADLDPLMEFYDTMCAALDKMDFLPDGNKGGFPPRAMVIDAINQGTQFVGEVDGVIAAAYIMDHNADETYESARWRVQAQPQEAMVLHALRVLPDFGGRGYSKRLVEHAIRTTKSQGQKAIRLDCIEGNDVPMHMYESFGFQRVDVAEITYPDIGTPMKFHLFELAL